MMLVLTRKTGQQILMDNGSIRMKVLKVEDDIISIGITAPQHIDIDREEIYLKKLQQKKSMEP
jgi:carbon storage regulator